MSLNKHKAFLTTCKVEFDTIQTFKECLINCLLFATVLHELDGILHVMIPNTSRNCPIALEYGSEHVTISITINSNSRNQL